MLLSLYFEGGTTVTLCIVNCYFLEYATVTLFKSECPSTMVSCPSTMVSCKIVDLCWCVFGHPPSSAHDQASPRGCTDVIVFTPRPFARSWVFALEKIPVGWSGNMKTAWYRNTETTGGGKKNVIVLQ